MINATIPMHSPKVPDLPFLKNKNKKIGLTVKLQIDTVKIKSSVVVI
jgi:hypothetical protein